MVSCDLACRSLRVYAANMKRFMRSPLRLQLPVIVSLTCVGHRLLGPIGFLVILLLLLVFVTVRQSLPVIFDAVILTSVAIVFRRLLKS